MGEDIAKSENPGMFDLKVKFHLPLFSSHDLADTSIGQSQEAIVAEVRRRGRHARRCQGEIRRAHREPEGEVRIRCE